LALEQGGSAVKPAPLGSLDALLTDFDRTLVWLFEDRAREQEAHRDVWTLCNTWGVAGTVRLIAGIDPYNLWTTAYRWLARLRPKDAETLNEAIASCLTAHELSAAGDVPLLEGVRDVLEQLDMLGIPVAVVSNNAAEAVWQALKANHVEGLVSHVLGREPGRRLSDLKPSPALLQEALTRLSCDAERALYIGDSISDIDAGRAAGMPTAAVRRLSQSSDAELTSAGADRLLTGFRDLASLLEARSPRGDTRAVIGSI
jgi:phosphoglycolate phosphatase